MHAVERLRVARRASILLRQQEACDQGRPNTQMDEHIGGIEDIRPMRDALNIDEIDDGTTQNTIQHIRGTATDDETEEYVLIPLRGLTLAAQEKHGTDDNDHSRQQAKYDGVTRKCAEGAAEIADVGQVEEAVDDMRLPDRQAGIDKVAADLRYKYHQQRDEDE